MKFELRWSYVKINRPVLRFRSDVGLIKIALRSSSHPHREEDAT